MRLHMDRLNAWCPAGQNALPPAMREHCTPELPVQGNTIEKSRGNLVRSNIGSADEAWTGIADKISGACARLRELVGAGLARPTGTERLSRLVCLARACASDSLDCSGRGHFALELVRTACWGPRFEFAGTTVAPYVSQRLGLCA